MDKIIFQKRNALDYRSNEAYKTLRTNIEFCGDDNKVLVITSCTPNEGKSSVSFNLAVSFSENGKRVVLVDADLRKSVLVGRYKVGEVKAGLTHYLSGQAKEEEVLHSTDIPNMDIIFAGTYSPNPAELLEHNRFRALITKLREEYDYVIIDSPPLGSVIDSAIVAKIADGAILVIESNAISHKFAQTVKNQLERSGCKILGAILNKVNIDTEYYGRYYGKYYGTYGKEE